MGWFALHPTLETLSILSLVFGMIPLLLILHLTRPRFEAEAERDQC